MIMGARIILASLRLASPDCGETRRLGRHRDGVPHGHDYGLAQGGAGGWPFVRAVRETGGGSPGSLLAGRPQDSSSLRGEGLGGQAAEGRGEGLHGGGRLQAARYRPLDRWPLGGVGQAHADSVRGEGAGLRQGRRGEPGTTVVVLSRLVTT